MGRWKKLILSTAVILLAATVLTTAAYLVVASQKVENTFTPVRVTCAVVQDDGMTNVKLKNTDEVTAFIRAAVVVNWVNAEGKILGKAPVEGKDYTISWVTAGWVQDANGFHYYTEAVPQNETTPILINSVSQLTEAPAGYTLTVQVVGNAIQAEPEKAAEESWGVSVSGDTLSIN